MRFKVGGKKSSNKATSVGFGKSIIGLDIGQSAIKMVQLSGKSVNNIQVEKYAIEHLPQNIVSGREILNYDQLVSYLQQCYEKLNTNCKQVNFALSLSEVIVNENLRFYPESESVSLEDLVKEQVLTVGLLDEMNYDWTVLDTDEKTQEQTILTVATKKDNVQRCVDLADEIGVSVANVDVDLFAAANAFLYADEMEGGEFAYERIAIFNVGDSSMKFMIMEGGKILYKQESSLGLEQLLQLVQRDYQVDYQEAKQIVSGRTKQPENYQEWIRSGFNVQIAQEIQRSIQFFLTTQNVGEEKIKQIFLSGSACIASTDLEQIVFGQTGIEVRQIAPITLANNKTKVDAAQFENEANALTVAFGLALRGLV